MINELLQNDLYCFFAINLSIFLISFTLFTLYLKQKKTTAILLSVSTTLILLYIFVSQTNLEDSKYKQFGVKRFASTNQIKSKFRKKSRDILNSDLENKDDLYSELQKLAEILSEKNKRIIYDKFGKIFENMDFDGKEFKELYYNLLKKTFYDYINMCFFWIIVSFVFCRLIRTFDVFNHSLKAVVISHFIFVYYMYSHEVDQQSFFDYFLPDLDMKKQIYYLEFAFAYILGIVWACLRIYLNNKKNNLKKMLGSISNIMADVVDLKKIPQLMIINKDLKELSKIIK